MAVVRERPRPFDVPPAMATRGISMEFCVCGCGE